MTTGVCDWGALAQSRLCRGQGGAAEEASEVGERAETHHRILVGLGDGD